MADEQNDDDERPCLHCLIVEVVDSFFAEYPVSAEAPDVIDTDEVITPAIERRILDFYCAGIARRGAPALDATEFTLSYRLCVLQHALKMIGRFENFERNGKTGYRQYIPHALGQARRMLAEMRADFPKLCSALVP